MVASKRAFGEVLRDLRVSVRLTQEELADRAAVSSRTIRDLERGAVSAPRASTAALLANALGLTRDDRERFLHAARDALWAGRLADTVPLVPVPRQLPADIEHFTGRTAELHTLDERNDAHRSGGKDITIVAIVGPAGGGKTALAVHWANRHADEFPHGQIYIDLRGYDARAPVTAMDALSMSLRAIGVPSKHVPTTVDDATAMHRSLLAQRRMLLLLDNARSAEQVRPLLPGGGGSVVVVTSRRQLSGLVARDGATQLGLDVLPLTDAVDLLTRVIGDERVAAERGPALELAKACGGLPLALRIAAANLHTTPHRSIADLAAALSDDSLDTLITDDERTTVRTVFDQSYLALDADESRMFRLLGIAPGAGTTASAAATLAGLPLTAARRLIGALTGAHLLEEVEGDRYRFHDLVRTYARDRSERTDTPADVDAALDRLYRSYLATVDAAARLVYPERLRLPVPDHIRGVALQQFADRDAANDWLGAERNTLTLTVPHAVEHGHGAVAWLLADALRGYFWLGGHWTAWLRTATAGLDAARAAGAADGEGACLISLGQALLHQGRLTEAVAAFADAATAMHRAAWPIGEIAARGHLGMTHLVAGRLPEARTAHVKAEALCRAAGSLQGAAFTLHRLAATATAAGNLDEALEYAQRGKQIFEQLGDRHGEAHILLNLADVHRDAGRLTEALATASTALALSLDLGQPVLEVEARIAVGSIHHLAGRHDDAADCYHRALTLSRDDCSRLFEVEALIGLANAHTALGRLDDGRDAARTALTVCVQAGFRLFEGDAHLALGAALLARGDRAAAAPHIRQGHEIHRGAGHRRGERRAAALLDELGADPH
jgi:tetratricopeptide (TPR) repeat protein/transcriptional regulator with XRE-family HTH domain